MSYDYALIAAGMATATGMLINAFTAGILSLMFKRSWKDIWLRLTSVMLLAILLGMISAANLFVTIIGGGFAIPIIMASGALKASKPVAYSGWLVAVISFIIGHTAASGNVALTETLTILGAITALLIAGLWGMLQLLTKKKTSS